MKANSIIRLIAIMLSLTLLTIPVLAAADLRTGPDVDLGAGNSPGDFDDNGYVNNKDVEYFLWHTLFPKDYPVRGYADFDKNSRIDNKDVEYLLWHTLFPGDYPLMDPIPE